jgi:hypothetical protein
VIKEIFMANTPIISQSEVQKVIIYSESSDGTLSPSIAVTPNLLSNSPLAASGGAKKIWLFTENADGTLSPASGI